MIDQSTMINRQISGVMWKTVSEACNLACDYCYYSTCNGRPGRVDRIDDETLEKFIREYMGIKVGPVSFTWQGGEPLLAGLEFFEKVVSLQAAYAKPGTIIANSIQTNGTIINRKWAEFFKKYNFLVGVSIDGPEEINDRHRVTSAGKGSYAAIMKGIQHLKDAGVEYNILSVIHEDNVTRAKDLMEFYSDEGFSYVQFIPCMEYKAQNVNEPGQYSITPKQYGDFLCEAFDYWFNDGKPDVSVRFFDNMLAVYLNQQAEMCELSEFCPKVLILEQNGDAYPCDFFLQDDYKLGNVGEDSLVDIVNHEKWDEFFQMKPTLPDQCKSCEFLSLCHGGCPRNRLQDDQEMGVEYFCESYKQIFKYAHGRMLQLANKIKKERLVSVIEQGFSIPRRNEACMCGSGKKFKKCCATLLD